MVLGRLLRGHGSNPPSPSSQSSEAAAHDVHNRCLLDASRGSNSTLVPSGRPVLFVDLEGTILRSFVRDDLREIPEDTHYANTVHGQQYLMRIRPHALDFLARMKYDWGLSIAVYAASSRALVVAKVEALEKAQPGFRFDFVVDMETANAWDNGAKQLRLILGGSREARELGFLIDTKDSHIRGQEKAGPGDSTIVNAVEIAEFGPFIANEAGRLEDMRKVYGKQLPSDAKACYAIFQNFEVENRTFKTWLQKAVGSSTAPGAHDVDWELVDAGAHRGDAGLVVEDEFLMIECVENAPCQSRGNQEEPSPKAKNDDKLRLGAPVCNPLFQAQPRIVVTKKPSDESSDGGSTSTDDEPSYRCLGCKIPVFKNGDILSSRYNAKTSPGYLLKDVRNVQLSDVRQTAIYTSGKYEIQDVLCVNCSAVLGVTYSNAADSRNQYKVGKFLVGCDRLQLPPGVTHPLLKSI